MPPSSVSVRFLRAGDVDASLDIPRLLAPIRRAFITLSDGSASVPVRGVVEADRGTTLLMGGSIPGVGLGAKVVSVFGGNAAKGLPTTLGMAILMDPETGEVRGLCDAGRLTAWRTGAASGVATDALARADARVCAIIGTGIQAETQLLAMQAVRELEEVRVYSRQPEARTKFAAKMRTRVSARVVAADDPRSAVEDADIICTATTSSTPVFPGDAVSPGTHVNAVGAFKPQMRELDAGFVSRARIFVDHTPAALAEAGDLLAAEREFATHRSDWIELGDVLAERVTGRREARDITLFESVGNATQDIAAGAVLLARATELGLGTELQP